MMANTAGEKELKTDWPVVSGIEADEKHEGRKMHLEPEEASLVPDRDKLGL